MPGGITALKAYLESRSTEELIKEVKELYRLFKSVQEYYEMRISAAGVGEEVLLNKYKQIIKNEFMPNRGFGQGRLSVARKAVNDFSKLSKNSLNVADIMVYYVELGVEFTNAYGDINEPFYNSMERMYDKASDYIETYGLSERFIDRLHDVVRKTSGIGWGFHDSLGDIFSRYFLKEQSPHIPYDREEYCGG